MAVEVLQSSAAVPRSTSRDASSASQSATSPADDPDGVAVLPEQS